MRWLMLVGLVLLAGCGDKQEVGQSSAGNQSPNIVAGGDVSLEQTHIENATINLPPELAEKMLQALKAQGVPDDQLATELEELKRKYADLEQRLGEYAKTDELAQQARKELEAGNLEQAETLLQQAYDKDIELSHQRQAQYAFDLAEVAELRLDHDKALARYREVTQLQPENLPAWRNVYTIASKIGNTGLALEASRGLQQHLDPENQDWLSIALKDEGIALVKLGDRKGAMVKYMAALELDQKRVKQNPDDTNWQYNLGISHERIGDIYLANGDTNAALASYQQRHEIIKKLVELDPKQTEWQRDLSVSHERIGDLYVANGDRAAALKSYQDSLAIAQKLVELDPRQTEWQRDLSVSYNKIGDLYVANGERAAALKSYQDSLAIRKTLVELDPKQTEWQRDLAVSHERIGHLLIHNSPHPQLTSHLNPKNTILYPHKTNPDA
ncbi:MAG: tetratricopeptide repeat protein, partial [Gammaproteobacteria bacterium]|nr:tetratricopeptide repeat protein [Gammaproteobacteria bacterium]